MSNEKYIELFSGYLLPAEVYKIFFSAAEFETGTRTIIPQTFHVLVYKLKSDN
jgi:hypothetical protein